MRSPSEARSRSGSTTIALARTDRIASSTPSSYKPCPLILAERRFSGPWGDDGDCDWQGKYFVDLEFRACEMKYHESFNIAFELLLSAHAVSSMSWHLISLTTDKIHIEHWFKVGASCTYGGGINFGPRSLGRVNAFAQLLVRVRGIDTSPTLLQPSNFLSPTSHQATRSKKAALFQPGKLSETLSSLSEIVSLLSCFFTSSRTCHENEIYKL